MPKNKKKFIDKKNSVTFHLVHRSQQDPLTADENAPQKVLLPSTPVQDKQKSKKKEEQSKFGIYFDDDYDYLQHLREANSTTVEWEKTPETPAKEKPNKIKLPSSVFASEVEEDVGLLNRAAPQSGLRLDLDPDIVAAMDEDFDYDNPDNQLDDDFIVQANASGDEFCEEEEDEYEDMSEDDASSGTMGGRSDDEVNDDDDLASLDREETKSRFTEFSMSSSVLPRNDQLTLLDDRFEQMFAEYDENEIGALDCEEIEGEINPLDDMVLRLAEEEFDKRSKVPDPEAGNTLLSDSNSSSEEDVRYLTIEEKEKWDCESVLSTYSNLYNHPKLITEPKTNRIRVSGRTGMPVAENNRLTAKNLAALGGSESRGPSSIISALSSLSMRNKDETLEQKKQRKSALKQYRKERRVERKVNATAFKEEKKRQEKSSLNTRVTNVAVHL